MTLITEENVTVVTYLKIDPWLISTTLSFGDDRLVIEPEVLRKNVRNKSNKMNNIYYWDILDVFFLGRIKMLLKESKEICYEIV